MLDDTRHAFNIVWDYETRGYTFFVRGVRSARRRSSSPENRWALTEVYSFGDHEEVILSPTEIRRALFDIADGDRTISRLRRRRPRLKFSNGNSDVSHSRLCFLSGAGKD